MYSKDYIIGEVWKYSKYHGNLLSYCDSLAKSDFGTGTASLLFLFNLIENIMKNAVNDYDSGFMDVLNKVRNQNLITEDEAIFLNAPNNSVRKLRNILAHSNLSKYSVVYFENGKDIYYPLTEEESCLKVYETISDVSFNIMLKVVSTNFTKKIDIDLSKALVEAKIQIHEHTPEELLSFKGLDHVTQTAEWQSLSETEKYRHAENGSDVNVVTHILKQLFDQDTLK